MKQPCVYILTNKSHTVLYIGVTSQLPQRIWQHKNKVVDGFSKRYQITELVWYEVHETMESAITREKRLKKWNREWKNALIAEMNPKWVDKYSELLI
ncbi:GIY-YIG nuclease family protein [Vibrio sp.]|nr:GIY-YIG nuclease family protein [Vibrio sp.]